MTIAANEQLRAVVNDYYHGLVSFGGYRERRGRILDLLGAPADPPAAEARAASAPDTTERPRSAPPSPAPAPAIATTPPPQPPARQSPAWAMAATPALRWAIVGAVGFVVLIGIGFAVLRSSPPEPAAVPNEPISAQHLPPGAALLEQFLQKNAWDQDAVRNLAVGWTSALTEEQRQDGATSPAYARFSDVLLRRLREEEALAGAGETPELERLVALAGNLKVPYVASLARPAQRGPPNAPERVPANDVGRAERESARGTASEPVAGGAPQTRDAAATPRAAATESRGSAGATPAVSAPPASTPQAAPAQTTSAGASGDSAAPACSAELLSSRRRLCNDSLHSGGDGPTLVIVPRGTFHMGNDQTRNASPAHDVTIAAPFAMSVYEVSFGEFERYCKAAGQRCPENPWSDAAFPVVLVSWSEAAAYAEWLSTETGERYRLPSESEWEYAARAGTQTPYPFGNDVTPSNARSSAISQVTSPIANTDRSVNRNQFQLLHMIGNVREWVADEWHPDYSGAPTDGGARLAAAAAAHAVRGGSYADSALQLRSAARISLDSATQDKLTGFRLVRELTR